MAEKGSMGSRIWVSNPNEERSYYRFRTAKGRKCEFHKKLPFAAWRCLLAPRAALNAGRAERRSPAVLLGARLLCAVAVGRDAQRIRCGCALAASSSIRAFEQCALGS